MKALKIVPVSLEATARDYKALQSEIKSLEEHLRELKVVLEDAALSSPTMTIDLGGFKITLSEASREVFSLKKAREIIEESVLEPFISKTHFSQLRVCEKKVAA